MITACRIDYYIPRRLPPGASLDEIARHVTLLFVAVSAADERILREEVFIMEKCALDYGIDEEMWNKALNDSFIVFFNRGEKAVSEAIYKLSKLLTDDQRRELVEDLLAIALADNIFHDKEKSLIKKVCRGFKIHMKVPKELDINCT